MSVFFKINEKTALLCKNSSRKRLHTVENQIDTYLMRIQFLAKVLHVLNTNNNNNQHKLKENTQMKIKPPLEVSKNGTNVPIESYSFDIMYVRIIINTIIYTPIFTCSQTFAFINW